MRKGKVYVSDRFAGIIEEDENGYVFAYEPSYLSSDNPLPVSLTLPLSNEEYHSKTMFPFFDGLIPEGWLLKLSTQTFGVNDLDRMGLLLLTCKDPIGNVSVEDYSDDL